MSLLKSGEIYFIKIGVEDYKDQFGYYPSTNYAYFDWIMQQYSSTLGINDSNYNQIKYMKNSDHSNAYFLLPYISGENEKEKLGIQIYPDSSNYFEMQIVVETDAPQDSTWDNYFKSTYWSLLDNGYYICKTDKGDESGSIELNSIREGNHTTLVIDTQFLDSHGFYTIGVASSANNILEAYVTPKIFICDMINKFNKKHVDGAICLETPYKFGNYPSSLRSGFTIREVQVGPPSIGVYILNDANTGFYPQVFTADESSFSMIKMDFGQYKVANNIYLTKVTNSQLANFCYYQNMLTEKNAWRNFTNVESSGREKKYAIGLNSIKNNDIDLTSFYNWLPVVEIEEDLSWPTGMDSKIFKIINNFYDNEITLDSIKEIWFLGDKRILSNYMMENANLEPILNKHISLTIDKFIENGNKNEIVFLF